ncbi:hypothetical protein ACK3TF_001284 [Chlorella vulgaris]
MAPLTFARLRKWNLGVGVFQLITGVTILAITPYSSETKLPFFTFFIASWSRDDGPVSNFYNPVPKKVANFPIGVWSGVFLLLSAADHLLVVLPRVNAVYNRYLCLNRNPFRWAEYSVSASLMSVMIAQLCGVTDIHLLFTIAALMASTMLFGHQMEVSNGARLTTYSCSEDPTTPPSVAKGAITAAAAAVPAAFITENGGDPLSAPGGAVQGMDWAPFWMGCWPFLAAELVTGCYFFQAVSNGSPPGFVWILFFILLVLYLLFAVNQALQFRQVRGWRGFAQAEWWYIILSLTSKQLLAWITYGGTKRFETN